MKKTIGGVAIAMIVSLSMQGCGGTEPDSLSYGQLTDDDLTLDATGLTHAESATVDRVVDGDTIQVIMPGGKSVPVRLIGLDAPETYPEVECGGDYATGVLIDAVSPGDPIELWTDPTQDEVDKYGRVLRYAVAADGTDLGLKVIRYGGADTYVHEVEFTQYGRYEAALNAAFDDALGGWVTC